VAPSRISPATTPPRCNVNRLHLSIRLSPLTSDIPVLEPLSLSLWHEMEVVLQLRTMMGCAPRSTCKVIQHFPIRFQDRSEFFSFVFSSSIHGVHVDSNVRLSGSNNISRELIGNRSRMHQGIQEPTFGGQTTVTSPGPARWVKQLQVQQEGGN
jgi:hypothetical protein